MALSPNPALHDLACQAYSDYLTACNLTDSFDRFNATPVQRLCFELARTLENSHAKAANVVMAAAYGVSHSPLDVDA